MWGGGGKSLLCVLGFILAIKEGFTFFILTFVCCLDFDALIGCLSFVAYHSLNNDCFITCLILI